MVVLKSRSILGFDVYLLVASLSLMVIGILFVYSSGVTATGEVFSKEYLKQIVWVAIGIAILFGVSIIEYSRLRDWAPYLYGAFGLALIATLISGKVVNGSRSWLGVVGLGFQPSEFMKIATILLLARYLERTGGREMDFRRFAVAFGIAMLPMLLILAQPDLGTALVYLPIFMFMVFTAGGKPHHIMFLLLTGFLVIVLTVLPAWQTQILGNQVPALQVVTSMRLMIYPLAGIVVVILLSLVGLVILKRRYYYWVTYASLILLFAMIGSIGARAFLKEYQIMRLIVFLDPYVDPRGAGWNIIQSVTAVGSGGLFGKGFLQGTQSHYQYLPQQSTDFIFSILAEEWGFFGAVVVFSLFMVILIRGLYIVTQAKDRFAAIAGSGIVGMIFFHFIVNVGMAIGIMPITGIPLFFLSHGGSSLWTALIGVGLLMSIYHHRYQY